VIADHRMAGLPKNLLNPQFNGRAVTAVINRDFPAKRRGEMRRGDLVKLAQRSPPNIAL